MNDKMKRRILFLRYWPILTISTMNSGMIVSLGCFDISRSGKLQASLLKHLLVAVKS